MQNADAVASAHYAVLVVEDDEALTVLFRALLVRKGWTVDCVPNGKVALEKLGERRYDAIVLDLMMPVMNGFDVMRHLAIHSPALLRRTIVTTGVNEKLLASFDASLVYAVIRKPFDITHLTKTVAECAAQPHERRSRRPKEKSAPPQADAEGERASAFAALHGTANTRFGERIGELRKLLKNASASQEELLLRAELRRVLGELRSVFQEAAQRDPNRSRADEFTRLARLAADIATAAPQPRSTSRPVPASATRHGH
jgi:CheY-like chemotaxis protein